MAAGLEIERDLLRCNEIAHSTDADHSKTLADTFAAHLDICGGCSVGHDCQRPAPAGQLAGDRGVGDHRAFLARIETGPAGVQPVVGSVGAGTRGRGGGVPAAAQIDAAKYWAAQGGQDVLLAAHHLHGGVGVDRDYPLYRYFLLAKQLELDLGSETPTLVHLGALIADTPVG